MRISESIFDNSSDSDEGTLWRRESESQGLLINGRFI